MPPRVRWQPNNDATQQVDSTASSARGTSRRRSSSRPSQQGNNQRSKSNASSRAKRDATSKAKAEQQMEAQIEQELTQLCKLYVPQQWDTTVMQDLIDDADEFIPLDAYREYAFENRQLRHNYDAESLLEATRQQQQSTLNHNNNSNIVASTRVFPSDQLFVNLGPELFARPSAATVATTNTALRALQSCDAFRATPSSTLISAAATGGGFAVGQHTTSTAAAAAATNRSPVVRRKKQRTSAASAKTTTTTSVSANATATTTTTTTPDMRRSDSVASEFEVQHPNATTHASLLSAQASTEQQTDVAHHNQVMHDDADAAAPHNDAAQDSDSDHESVASHASTMGAEQYQAIVPKHQDQDEMIDAHESQLVSQMSHSDAAAAAALRCKQEMQVDRNEAAVRSAAASPHKSQSVAPLLVAQPPPVNVLQSTSDAVNLAPQPVSTGLLASTAIATASTDAPVDEIDAEWI